MSLKVLHFPALTVLMALLGVAACDDRHPVVMPAAQLSEENDVRWTALNLPQDSIFEDPPQLDLARKLPSFAGVLRRNQSGSARDLPHQGGGPPRR
jgi:hypothetical protein